MYCSRRGWQDGAAHSLAGHPCNPTTDASSIGGTAVARMTQRSRHLTETNRAAGRVITPCHPAPQPYALTRNSLCDTALAAPRLSSSSSRSRSLRRSYRWSSVGSSCLQRRRYAECGCQTFHQFAGHVRACVAAMCCRLAGALLTLGCYGKHTHHTTSKPSRSVRCRSPAGGAAVVLSQPWRQAGRMENVLAVCCIAGHDLNLVPHSQLLPAGRESKRRCVRGTHDSATTPAPAAGSPHPWQAGGRCGNRGRNAGQQSARWSSSANRSGLHEGTSAAPVQVQKRQHGLLSGAAAPHVHKHVICTPLPSSPLANQGRSSALTCRLGSARPGRPAPEAAPPSVPL